jgi:hypothetical protein
VGVTLNPSFHWDFGDGDWLSSSQPGAPLPDTTISHIYRKAGRYIVTLQVSWLDGGETGAYTYPVIGGAIVQSYSTLLTVSPASTIFTK